MYFSEYFYVLSHSFCVDMRAQAVMYCTSSLENLTLAQASARAENLRFRLLKNGAERCVCPHSYSKPYCTLPATVALLHKCPDQNGEMETLLCSASATNFLHGLPRYSTDTAVYI